MNIEEKAIEVLKHCKDRNFSAFDKIYFDDGTNMCIYQAIETLLTAYEKEKEKNEYLPSWVNRKYISKDKIEAKIEEKFLEAKGLYERGVQPQAQYTMKLLRDLEKSLLEKE